MKLSNSNSLASIQLQNDAFEAEILLQGAQLMHFAPRGQKEWIFRSPNTPYTPQREIYGGIPVIFPWFGRLKTQPESANHAFARQAVWKVSDSSADESQITLTLSSQDALTQGIDTTLWPYDFEARMIFTFGKSLGLRFEVENQSDETVRFECALHTYFAVESIDSVRVEGLEGEPFRNGHSGNIETQNGEIHFGQALSQIFETTGKPVQIRDANRTFALTPREGWHSTILWNPGSATADLSDDDAQNFVCVEAGAIGDSAVSVEPGQTYALDFSIEAL